MYVNEIPLYYIVTCNVRPIASAAAVFMFNNKIIRTLRLK